MDGAFVQNSAYYRIVCQTEECLQGYLRSAITCMTYELKVSLSYLWSKEAVQDIGGIFGAVEHSFLYFSKGCLKRF